MEAIDRNRLSALVLAITIFAAGILLVRYLKSPAQLGEDERVMKTVDALFTAITSKDSQQLSNCEDRLEQFVDEGDLAPNAGNALAVLIDQARDGQWESSARKLYDFILAQRRGG
jgi:hypothetical protein